MPRRCDRPEDAGYSGRLGAKRLVGQSAAGQANRDRALINGRKGIEPREMRREGRSAPDGERRIFHKQLGLIGEMGHDHAAAMAVVIAMVVMAMPIIISRIAVIVLMGMIAAIAMAVSMIAGACIMCARIMGVRRLAVMGMAVIVIMVDSLSATTSGEPESKKRKPD